MEQEFNDKQVLIMDKALEVFAEKGFEAASVREIARHAGVNLAMISYYFGSKDKLLEAIFIRHVQETMRTTSEIRASEAYGPLEKIGLLIDTYVTGFFRKAAFHKLVVREQVLAKAGPLYMQIREMKIKNRALLEEIIHEGQRLGIFRSELEIPMLAHTMVGSINHVIANRAFVCEYYNIAPEDNQAFEREVIDRLRIHLKTMFKAYLTYEAPGKTFH